ncbi:response regulator transcription factor [Microvirga sp. STR05]|uniref:Response regulator transcription factor n=1 Tax=Hymenobacter duratus TaxID=2771356 RepID=A0ABR8JGN7_9BACT|nr:response regulator transcription factor [Hymenobacter duratus]MBD2714512.1 response regulator transcription factor [Hymenobacter duratus]MBR7949416.1 response regulator transcription factor [Microvirga sp. STR05]
MSCRLLILDDHLMLTQSLALLMAEQPDLEVAGQFGTGDALLAWLPTAGPVPADVLLLDLQLPAPDGLTLLPLLRRQWPALRILVFSTASTPELLTRVAEAGANGFVPKSSDADHLLAAIRAVYEGKSVFPKSEHKALVAPADSPLLQRLSVREREIVSLIRAGLTTRDIAEQLSLSEFTVSTHRRNIMHKLELHNVAVLVQFAQQHGL